MKDIEIEAKYIIDDTLYNGIYDYLSDKGYKAEEEKQNDIYFSPIHFPFLGGDIDNECLRIRILDDKNILSYKKFVAKTKDNSSYCVEHEIEIKDIDGLINILQDLRIEKTITIKKVRKYFNIDNIVEVSLDDVCDLGKFVEIEIKDGNALDKAEEFMNDIRNRFKLTDDMRDYEGYSYLLYEKYKNQ